MSATSLLFIKALDGHGHAEHIESINATAGKSGPLWFHFDANHPDAYKEIHRNFPDVDEHSLRAIFTQDARPRTLQLENGTLLILRGINHNEGEEPEDMIAVRLWITENRVISLRFRKSRALMQVAEDFDRKHGPKNIGDIVSSISSNLLEYIEISIEKLNEKIDLLEARVLDEPDRQLRLDIAEVRKSAILLRRYISPQKEAINQLRFSDAIWLSDAHHRRIQEAHDTLLRGMEELDAIRERSQIVKDELVNSLSDRLNRNLYVISVITAIFLPLGFLTGLFGINIGGMPGVENSAAFGDFVIALLILVAIQIGLFKWFKWF